MLNIKLQKEGKPKSKPKRRRRDDHKAFNLGLLALSICGVLAVEFMIAGTLLHGNQITVTVFGLAIPVAYAQAALSVVLGCLASAGAVEAGRKRADPRKAEQAKAGKAQAWSYACTIIPIWMLAIAASAPILQAEHQSYISGSLYPADKAAALQNLADDKAQDRLAKWENAPAPLGLKPEWLIWSVLVYGLITQAPGRFVRAAPETPAEVAQRLNEERAAKARATREANVKADHERQLELIEAQEKVAKAARGNRLLGRPAIAEVKTA